MLYCFSALLGAIYLMYTLGLFLERLVMFFCFLRTEVATAVLLLLFRLLLLLLHDDRQVAKIRGN